MAVTSNLDTTDWTRAFPARMATDVTFVVRALPVATFATSGHLVDSERHPRGISVEGQPVEIPARQYRGAVGPGDYSHLSSVQLGIAACVYSRHHDGHVRQSWLPVLLAFDDACAAPFVTQLIGEYVVEIVSAIKSFLDSAGPDSPLIQRLSAIAVENPAFIELTASRARSYWWEYYTHPYATYDSYPASKVLNAILATA